MADGVSIVLEHTITKQRCCAESQSGHTIISRRHSRKIEYRLNIFLQYLEVDQISNRYSNV